MSNALYEEIERAFPEKGFLTIEDLCHFLSCERKTIYNWSKRADVRKQPPRLIVGKSLRFPKKEFVRWLVEEQLRSSFQTI